MNALACFIVAWLIGVAVFLRELYIAPTEAVPLDQARGVSPACRDGSHKPRCRGCGCVCHLRGG